MQNDENLVKISNPLDNTANFIYNNIVGCQGDCFRTVQSCTEINFFT